MKLCLSTLSDNKTLFSCKGDSTSINRNQVLGVGFIACNPNRIGGVPVFVHYLWYAQPCLTTPLLTPSMVIRSADY